MFGSEILDVALGLALLYLLLAVICSTLNEWIAGILKLRAKTLREGIANMLEDPEVKGIAKQFFDHPLVKGLTRKGENNLPSYIPASTFTAAMLDIILPANPSAGPADPLQVYQSIRARLIELAASDSELAKGMLILVDQAGIDPRKVQDATYALRQLEQVRTHLLLLTQQMDTGALQNLQPLAESLDKFKDLEASLRQAEISATAALLRAQENVERYYDQAMDRVSGWYKRRAQVIIVVLAVTVTALLNADSIAITRYLATNAATRELVAAIAEDYYRGRLAGEQGASASIATEQPEASGRVTASLSSSTPVTVSTTYSQLSPVTVSAPISLSASISETVAILDELGLPMGWKELPVSPQAWVYKLAGLLLTAIAVSLGAPFWFELLGKLIDLRMAGKKPADAATGKSVGISTVMASRLVPELAVGAAPPRSVGSMDRQAGELAELAARAVAYVEELKRSRTLTMPERDVAVAWMLMETTNQGISVSPAQIMEAIDAALRGS